MNFIINTFDKSNMGMLAEKLKGKVVSENETLVLAESENFDTLYEKVEIILETDCFRITEND